jgi:hypothetical protein
LKTNKHHRKKDKNLLRALIDFERMAAINQSRAFELKFTRREPAVEHRRTLAIFTPPTTTMPAA